MQVPPTTRSAAFESVLVLLLVFAGCSALPFSKDEAPTRTLTPAAVPTDRHECSDELGLSKRMRIVAQNQKRT